MSSSSPSSLEQRQHINLSQYAYEVIQNDSLTMMGKKNISGFINTILENCGELYFEDNELRKQDDYPKEVTLKIRLNNANYKEYYPSNGKWIGSKVSISQGKYIKAILENYSRKTFYDRESIFYKPIIDKVNGHIHRPKEDRGLTPIVMKDGSKYYVKPHRFSNNYEAPYHYLICMSSTEPSGEYRPASIRVSRIANVKDCTTSYRKKLSSKDETVLERHAKETGVPYMLGDLMEFEIRLTQQGLDMYNSMYYQRPIYNSIINEGSTYLLTFNSTERQIENYFFALAKEAEIISPESTREWMKNRYHAAWNSYNNSSL